jgi:hypothetical protein
MAAVLVAALGAGDAPAAPAPNNLLLHRTVRSSRGTDRPEQLTDGLLAPEGDPVTSMAASSMKGLRPYVEWDLGEPTGLVAAAVQADNNDTYRISTSLDGKEYSPLWTLDPVKEPGLRERVTRDLAGTARYVRFEAVSGDQTYAASEVRVYREVPAVWPPTRFVREPWVEDKRRTRDLQAQSLKLVVGFIAFPVLFLLLPRLRKRARRSVALAFVLLGVLSWIQFGSFNGAGGIHYWDSFHYFMGAKYFPETGYFDLYRCVAAAEREAGNGTEVDKVSIRDLENNVVYPGDWTRTAEGRCRARFSKDRWSAFRADLAVFHGLFLGHTIPDAFGDHGFNATPPNVVWLRLWNHDLPASRAHVLLLTQLDSVALAGTVAMVWWGFGGLPAAVVALVLGIGAFWNFQWVGGSFSRHTWLLCCMAGFACLARGRHFAGGVALTLAGLLRLFPFVLVGGVGLWALVPLLRTRRLERAGRRFLAGTFITFALGVGVAGSAVGFGSFPAFARVFERHSSTPSANQLGFSKLLSWTAGEGELADTRLTDPAEPWTHRQIQRSAERRPLWALSVVISLGVILLSVWQGATAAECGALSGLLLFSALPMTSYDYTWLVVLVALAHRRPHILPALLAFAVLSEVLFIFGTDDTMGGQHLIGSAACLCLLVTTVPWRSLWELIIKRIAPGPSDPSAST